MIRAKVDIEPDIYAGDLFIPCKRMNIAGGYEYEVIERLSDAKKFRIYLGKLCDPDLFDDPEYEDDEESYNVGDLPVDDGFTL